MNELLCVPFYKLNPSGNITLLFENNSFSPEAMHTIAKKALKASHLHAEQAGFVNINEGILRMAGGEFCVNATRSLALLMALEHFKNCDADTWKGQLNTSGYDSKLCAFVKKCVHGKHQVDLGIPILTMPPIQKLDKSLNLVRLPGIDHLLIDANTHAFDVKNWQYQSKELRDKYNLGESHAIGCIWWKKKSGENTNSFHIELHPVVTVPQPFSEHYENSCGSGSLALALFLHTMHNINDFYMHQPGGTLRILLDQNNPNSLFTAHIDGSISLIASGEAFF